MDKIIQITLGRGTLECQWVVAKVLKVFLEEAMQCDVTNLNTPRYYIKCLLDNEDLEEAEKLINYSLKIKGIDKATMWFYRSLLSEKRGSFLNALKFLSESEKYCFSSQSLDVVKDRKKFIKSKMPKKKSKNRKETK